MEIASKYNPAEVEGKWYQYWLDNGFFKSKPDGREPYTIVIPPPNVTGVLHMGHMLNNTIQDILVRRARMMGKNACWVPGTDHASIATEAKVVNRLAGQGIKKTDLTRDEFLRHAWEWKEEHGGIILKQLRKLGASCDWDRTAFTMDEKRSESVIKVFVDLYKKGLIYRGVRMVNWDPKALTALSDEEVIYKEEHSKLYYLRYKIVGEEGYAIVATTRPETIMGDTAMCINPNDPKNQHLRGKKVIVPLVGREIPVIEDDYVDIEFGTGCLKVTPAHDVNDYMLGEKYNLPSIDIFNDNGTLSEAAGLYVGMEEYSAFHDHEDVLANVIYLVKQRSPDLTGYMEQNIVELEEYSVLGYLGSYIDALELDTEDMVWLIDEFRRWGRYTTVVFDMGQAVLKDLAILGAFDEIMVPELKDELSQDKLGMFERVLERRELGKIARRLHRLNVPLAVPGSAEMLRFIESLTIKSQV